MENSIKEIIEKVNQAFSDNKTEDFLDYCTDDVRWTMVGKPAVTGKDAIRESMNNEEWLPPTITLHSIIVEENRAASDGEMNMSKRNGQSFHYSFCDLYEFRDRKIAALISYLIRLS